MVNNVEIHPQSSIIILDSVTFCVEFAKASIDGGHPSGPVFSCGAARAVLRKEAADRLVSAGVLDRR